MKEKQYKGFDDAGIELYLDVLSSQIKMLEDKEMYEACAKYKNLMDSIKTKDVEKYIHLMFDVEGLTREGFLKEKDSITNIENRILKFFDLENIFHYSLMIEGGLTSITKKRNNDEF